MKKVCIMQPTYLPWPGYFGLMMISDLFILLDNVQFKKRGWQQRNKIKTSTGEIWLTVPVISKNNFNQKINEVKLLDSKKFKTNHLKSLKVNYSKSQYYNKYINEIEEIYNKEHKKLVEINIDFINWIKEKLKIKTQTIKSSNLTSSGKKDILLANLVNEVGYKKYIYNEGSENYIFKSDEFKKNDIDLVKFKFNITKYHQLFGKFIPYMSVLDLMFNCGEESKNIIFQASSFEEK